MTKPYKFFINPFMVNTKGSYRTCKKIIDYTLARLNKGDGNEPFTTFYNNMLPHVVSFNTLYGDWGTQKGSQKSKTSLLTQNLNELSSELIRTWDVRVQVVFDQNSFEYKAIFPNRRKPFQQGSQEDRIAALDALSGSLEGIAALETLKTDVDGFFGTLSANYASQKNALGDTREDSGNIEAARIVVCHEMYNVLGGLMMHFYLQPEQAGTYFDLVTIRNREQNTYTHDLAGNETRLVFTHTFEAETDEVLIINEGNTIINFALCAEENDVLSAPIISVPANDERIVTVAELGDVAHRYLKAQNMSETEEGRYSVTIL